MELKRIGPWSVGKMLGVVYSALGLVVGGFVALFGLIGTAAAGGASDAGAAGAMIGMGLASVVIVPIFYGLMGLIGGALSAWLYNLAARFIGGIELEIDIPGLTERQFE